MFIIMIIIIFTIILIAVDVPIYVKSSIYVWANQSISN